MSYGNILILFHADNAQTVAVESILAGQAKQFEKTDGGYFVETTTIKSTKTMIDDIASTGVTFIFFHNKIADGSYIRSLGMDPAVVSRVNSILF